MYKRQELINAKKKGFKSYILYLIQREDCKFFKIASDIDKEYKKAFDEAAIKPIDIDYYCATCGPGLIGGLLVGSIFTKSLLS